MQRREFITLLGGAAAAWPLAARAQQPPVPVVGVLHGHSPTSPGAIRLVAGISRGLGEAGFVVGRNVAIERRFAEDQYERLPGMATDLVAHKVAVIFTPALRAAIEAARTATQTIPIVFLTGNDPVASGYVSSLNRPGGNATGVSFLAGELVPKRLELLREAIPSAAKFAALVDSRSVGFAQSIISNLRAAANHLGVEIVVFNAATDTEIEGAFASAVQQGAAALGQFGPVFSSRTKLLVELGIHHALPTLGVDRDWVEAGMLMSYGANVTDMYRQAGVYVGRILKGEKPADLPVQQPTKFELIVNLKTARAIGLKIPETFLVRADEVIE